MNLICIERNLSGIHLVNFQGGRQAQFKSSTLVDDKLILLSISLPQGDQNKRWNGTWEESGGRGKSNSCGHERKEQEERNEREKIKMCTRLLFDWEVEKCINETLPNSLIQLAPQVSYLHSVEWMKGQCSISPQSKNEY